MKTLVKETGYAIETIVIDAENKTASYVKKVVGGDVFTDTKMFKSRESAAEYGDALVAAGYTLTL